MPTTLQVRAGVVHTRRTPSTTNLDGALAVQETGDVAHRNPMIAADVTPEMAADLAAQEASQEATTPGETAYPEPGKDY